MLTINDPVHPVRAVRQAVKSAVTKDVLRGGSLSVGFVLLNRFTLMPFAAFVDCLRLAADEGDRGPQVRCGRGPGRRSGSPFFAVADVAMAYIKPVAFIQEVSCPHVYSRGASKRRCVTLMGE